jgi:phosphoenolpyruvate-protein kinase (PTS system EI component)
MNPRAIPDAKSLIRQLNDERARKIADEALQLVTAAEIESYMEKTLANL